MPIGSHWAQAETVDAAQSLTPDDIEGQQFETVMRGYDPAAVVGFLRDVARSFRETLERADQAQQAIDAHVCPEAPEAQTVEAVREASLEPPVDQYQAMSDEVATVLRAAYESAAEVRASADRDAEAKLADATKRLEELERSIAAKREQAEIEMASRRQRSEEDAAALVAAAEAEANRVRRQADDHVAAVRDEERQLGERLAGAGELLEQLLGRVRGSSEADSASFVAIDR